MLNIGCHLSVSKGFKNMGKEALSINANNFQFFTRNTMGGKEQDLDWNWCHAIYIISIHEVMLNN